MATPHIGPRFIQRTYQTSIFTWQDPGTAKLAAEVYIRAMDGLFYHILGHARVANRTLTQLCHDTYSRGFYSHRPYSVSQAADSSCVYGVLALMLNLFDTQGIDLAEFFEQVTEWPARPLLLCSEWVPQATWEGVIYPPVWATQEIDALKRSLREQRLQSMVNALERQLPA